MADSGSTSTFRCTDRGDSTRPASSPPDTLFAPSSQDVAFAPRSPEGDSSRVGDHELLHPGSTSTFRCTDRGDSTRPASSPPDTLFAPSSQDVAFAPRSPEGDSTRVGDHELLEELARGGMGVVYRARDHRLNRFVALKTIRPDQFERAENIRRFYDEAEAIAALEHPHIVPIYEVGRHGLQHYFTMRLMEGGTLSSAAPALREDPIRVARLISQVARAVHHAHGLGVLHRDLKPSNVLLDAAGRPFVADFGLAQRLKHPDIGDDEVGLVGTPAFMSPEQATPDARRLTTATDIYGLGAILYVLLTGRPPFHSGSASETLRLIRDEPVPPPSRVAPGVNPDLEAICLLCLEKDPGRRYASASSMADDLDRFREGRTVRARPRTVRLVVSKWARRRPLFAVMLLLLGLTALAGAVGVVAAWRVAERNADLARRRAYAAAIRLADRELEHANLDSVGRILRQVGPAGDPSGTDLRGFEWRYLDRLCRLDLKALTGHPENAPYAVAFHPAGRLVASAGAGDEILVHDAETGAVVARFPHAAPINGMAYFDSGRRLATIESRGRLRIMDARTGRAILDLPAHEGRARGLAASADGRRLATCGHADGLVKVWNAADGALLATLAGHEGPVRRVALDPAGGRVVSAGKDATVRIWDVAAGREERRLVEHRAPVAAVAFSPKGDRFATADEAGTVLIRDAADGRPTRTLASRPAGILSLAFSPDGRRLAIVGTGQTVVVQDLDSQGRPIVFRGHTDTIFDVTFDAEGRRLASAAVDGTVRIWDATRDPATALVGAADSRFRCLASDPRGRWIAAGAKDGVVRLWMLDATRAERRFAEHGQSGVSAVAASPDGLWLASGDNSGRIIVRDAATGRVRHDLRGHAATIRDLAFSIDGDRVASACEDGTVRLWDWRRGRGLWVRQSAQPPAYSLTFAPDRRSLLVGSHVQAIEALDLADGRLLRRFEDAPDYISALVVAPDGATVAGVVGARSIGLWDLRSGRALRTLEGHKGQIHSLAYNPDGSRLVSGSLDQSIRVWETGLGQELLAIRGHDDQVFGVRFVDGGEAIVSASEDGTVRRWDSAGR